MKRWLLALAVLAFVGLTGRSARAQGNFLFHSGNVITGNTWHAPTTPGDGTSGSCALTGELVNYDGFRFYTDTTADTYSLQLYYESYQSGFVYLYRDAFDPDDPCAGIFVFGYAPIANIYDIHLDAGRQYFFVTSEDRFLIGGGSYQVTIEGPPGSVLQFGRAPGTGVTVSVAPVDPPVVIGPGGGRFSYTVTLTNTTDEPQSFQAWTAVAGPAAREPVLGPVAVTLPAGATLTRALTQRVPADVPPGAYTYLVRLGTLGGDVVASDSFPFTKEPGAPAARQVASVGAAEGWSASGWDEAEPAAASLPGGFALSEAHPNPFADEARLTLEIAETQAVTVALYDALGRRVAVLLDGAAEAGVHALTLDGSSLPAGVYVVRATGESFAATRRVTLLR